MKSLQQRLQSRISVRRNCIRDVEDNIAMYKAAKMMYKVQELNKRLAYMAEDQKLDKKLFAFGLMADKMMDGYDTQIYNLHNLITENAEWM
jgi:hypothetical protein